jgi:CRP/FNR family cyclic AMP-dependent transcriptional regulator
VDRTRRSRSGLVRPGPGGYASEGRGAPVSRERNGVVRAMAATPLLDGAATPTIERLADRGRVRRYRRGTYLFCQGDDAPEVLLLLEGRVQVSSDSAGGHRQLHTTLEPPQFFGELGVLGEMGRTASALALEESTAWVIPGEDFLAFLSEEPSAARALLRALARHVQANEAFVEDLLYLDLKGRVAKRLLQLVSPSLDRLPEDGAVVPAIVTHADLASLCGGSRENVTRILSDLQRRGLIAREGRRFVLRRIGGLAKLADV